MKDQLEMQQLEAEIHKMNKKMKLQEEEQLKIREIEDMKVCSS